MTPSKSGKLRILIVSSIFPSKEGGGGRLAMYRHFLERDDFDVRVACVDELEDGLAGIQLKPPLRRFRRTRFSRFARNFSYLFSGLMSPQLEAYITTWRPDLVFGVPDLEHVGLQRKIARKYAIPFVANFQDIFPVSTFLPEIIKPYGFASKILLKWYHMLSKEAHSVLHTSQGMRDFFARETRSFVLYPLGEHVQLGTPSPSKKGPWKIVYAGNCYGSYGELMLKVAKQILEKESMLDLEIYTMGNDWNPSDVEKYSEAGILKGFLPFAELNERLESADAFLTVMSFAPADRLFVETSFTTKWLDYAPKAKPIFVWAPEYSSAAKFARETNAGVVTTSPKVNCLISQIKRTMKNSDAHDNISKAANQVAKTSLNPSIIHQVLTETFEAAATNSA
jgi:hypothetical protein